MLFLAENPRNSATEITMRVNFYGFQITYASANDAEIELAFYDEIISCCDELAPILK